VNILYGSCFSVVQLSKSNAEHTDRDKDDDENDRESEKRSLYAAPRSEGRLPFTSKNSSQPTTLRLTQNDHDEQYSDDYLCNIK